MSRMCISSMHIPTFPAKQLTQRVGFPKFHNRMTDIKYLSPGFIFVSSFPKELRFVQQILLKIRGVLNALHLWQLRSLLYSYIQEPHTIRHLGLSCFGLYTWVEQSHYVYSHTLEWIFMESKHSTLISISEATKMKFSLGTEGLSWQLCHLLADSPCMASHAHVDERQGITIVFLSLPVIIQISCHKSELQLFFHKFLENGSYYTTVTFK